MEISYSPVEVDYLMRTDNGQMWDFPYAQRAGTRKTRYSITGQQGDEPAWQI
ncbi:MAG: hypothetical protein P8X60_03160 [Robiginitalea sp.]